MRPNGREFDSRRRGRDGRVRRPTAQDLDSARLACVEARPRSHFQAPEAVEVSGACQLATRVAAKGWDALSSWRASLPSAVEAGPLGARTGAAVVRSITRDTQVAMSETQPPPIKLNAIDRSLLRLLLVLCSDRGKRSEAEIDETAPPGEVNPEDFDKLTARFGDDFHVKDLRVLDVGCGSGDLAISMAGAGADATGIDIDKARIRQARERSEGLDLAGSARFVHRDFLEFEDASGFDRVMSLEAFEHIPRPGRFLPKMVELLRPGGKILSVFGPMWLSPFGGHQDGYTKFPWLHLLFPEAVALTARRLMYRPTDPATRWEDIRGGLNRITVRHFVEMVDAAGLEFDRFDINPQITHPALRGLNRVATGNPFVREFFSHTVLCVMQPRRSLQDTTERSLGIPTRQRRSPSVGVGRPT